MRAAETEIQRDGLTLTINEKPMLHPAAKVVKESRSQMMQALKMLNLDLEPLKGVGRPSRGIGV
jgi:hypothetical protein